MGKVHRCSFFSIEQNKNANQKSKRFCNLFPLRFFFFFSSICPLLPSIILYFPVISPLSQFSWTLPPALSSSFCLLSNSKNALEVRGWEVNCHKISIALLKVFKLVISCCKIAWMCTCPCLDSWNMIANVSDLQSIFSPT